MSAKKREETPHLFMHNLSFVDFRNISHTLIYLNQLWHVCFRIRYFELYHYSPIKINPNLIVKLT